MRNRKSVTGHLLRQVPHSKQSRVFIGGNWDSFLVQHQMKTSERKQR